MEQRVQLQRLTHRGLEPNPALLRQADQRAKSIENRIADWVTAFAGSMPFVYIHIAWFGCWIGLGVEKYPYGLTMIVSLEAIFLSTFVMISQNRADTKRQAIADQQWQTVKEEDSKTKSCSSSRVRSSTSRRRFTQKRFRNLRRKERRLSATGRARLADSIR